MKEIMKEIKNKIYKNKNIVILTLFGSVIIISSSITFSQKSNFEKKINTLKNEIQNLENKLKSTETLSNNRYDEIQKLSKELETEKNKTPEEKQKELDQKARLIEEKKKETEEKIKADNERKVEEEKARNKVPTKEEFLHQTKSVSIEKRKYYNHMMKGLSASLPEGATAEYIEYLHMAMIDTTGKMKQALKQTILTKNKSFKTEWNAIVENYKNISIEISNSIDSDMSVGLLNPTDESDFILIIKKGHIIHNFWED